MAIVDFRRGASLSPLAGIEFQVPIEQPPTTEEYVEWLEQALEANTRWKGLINYGAELRAAATTGWWLISTPEGRAALSSNAEALYWTQFHVFNTAGPEVRDQAHVAGWGGGTARAGHRDVVPLGFAGERDRVRGLCVLNRRRT